MVAHGHKAVEGAGGIQSHANHDQQTGTAQLNAQTGEVAQNDRQHSHHSQKVGQGNYKLFGRIDLQVDLTQDISQSERLYQQSKRIMGITDSYQGQADSTAQSGKAKQIQVNQSAGRLDSKRKMKNAAYAEIDEVIFLYYLAYADEPRAMSYVDSMGRLQNAQFNRYDFIERDENGEYYYNTQYLFGTDPTGDVEQSRETIWSENRLNFQNGCYGNPQQLETLLIFWQQMERHHYPDARDMVERIRGIIEAQREQLEQQLTAEQQKNKDLQTQAYIVCKWSPPGSRQGSALCTNMAS